MALAEALRGHRTVSGQQYPFFYNPMWGCFGERDATPAGTYFYDSGEHVSYYWNSTKRYCARAWLTGYRRKG